MSLCPPTSEPALAQALRRKMPRVREFLCTALDLDPVQEDALCQAGIPIFHVRNLLQTLERHAELRAGRWDDAARLAYRALLQEQEPRTHKLDQLPAYLRPRERAQALGVGLLTESELLAIILGTGGKHGVLELAERLLIDHEGLPGLAGSDIDELMQREGLGPAKATEVAAAFELGRRLAQAERRKRPVLQSPEEAVALISAELAALPHEEFWLLALDVRSRLIGEPRAISRGDVDGTEAGPRAFFRTALAARATSAIAVHNHPSGDATASQADLAITRRLVEAGRILEIPLADHLIIAAGNFTSLRRERPELFH